MVRWRVREILAQKGMSLYRFGKLIGYKQAHSVHTAFPKDGSFRRITARVLNNACRVLDVTPGDLIEYIPDDPPASRPSRRKPRET